MTITILTGLPGSGKSQTLISHVNSARREGRTVLTFMCGDSPTLQARPRITERGEMGCRAGLFIPLNHFVSAERAIELMESAPVNALLAFDEAQHFGDELVDAWRGATERGADVLIASPSPAQLLALKNHGHNATKLRLLCEICRTREASRFFCFHGEDRTESVCEGCFRLRRHEAEREIIGQLRDGEPHPGQEYLDLPVELTQCRDWAVARDDSQENVRLMLEACGNLGLPRPQSTYLDVGCGTGYFCNRMAEAGFHATGIDVRIDQIKLARLLSAYCRNDHAVYSHSGIDERLASKFHRGFDVVSAFAGCWCSAYQTNPKQTRNRLRQVFRTTRHLCVLAAGGPGHSALDAPEASSTTAAEMQSFMQTEGGFARIERVGGKYGSLGRQLLIGTKARPASRAVGAID